ncbi:hypothetical protein BKA64DRAFT_714345 [Cadophora sp. MPI-SDFR-AT-0126]|nr:hypothetical protein BKA64DRAFT_714345 [Leotiomycetes sp. MPI-SDFR-AT-0126]
MLTQTLYKGGSRREAPSIAMIRYGLFKGGSRQVMHSHAMPILQKQTADGLEGIAEDELYRFTRYQWLYRESEQLAMRYRKFNVLGLVDASVRAAGKGAKACVEIVKCIEGQYNKAFLMKMDNGEVVVARLPHPNAGPAFYTTASEVATRRLLRTVLKVSVPRILAYAANVDNPVGAEYIIEEEAHAKHSSGDASGQFAWNPEKFAFGPLTEAKLWQGERAWSQISRGPWASPSLYLEAMGENEEYWSMNFAKAQILPYEADERAMNGDSYEGLLQLYHEVIPPLAASGIPASLSHPDLGLHNIFVDPKTRKITSFTGWQSASVSKPFFHSRLPSMLVSADRRYSDQQEAIAESENADIATDLVDYYQIMSKVKTVSHWGFVNTQHRELLYDPASLITGALSRNDVFPLKRAV